MSKEAMKLALAAIESEGWCDTEPVITALRDALAEQPAQQEPDAFVPREAIRTLSGGANHVPATLALNDDGGKAVAVFLSPQPAQRTWVGLTDEEIEAEFGFIDELLRNCCYRTEAKLKEKNT